MSGVISVKKHKRGKALSSGEKEMVVKVFESLKEGNPIITIKDIAKATANCLGISSTTVFKIIKEVRAEGRCKSPKRTKLRYRKYDNMDESTKDAIKKKVEMLDKNKPPTIDAIHKLVIADANLPNYGRTTFYRILQEMDLVCCRKTGAVPHSSTSNSETWPKMFHDENGQAYSSATMHESSQIFSSGETPVESEVFEGIHIKDEPVEEMEIECVPSDDSVADEVNLPPIEHVSVGEVDVKLEFEVVDEETLSSESATQTPETEPLAVVTKGTTPCPGVVSYDRSKALVVATRPDGEATGALQIKQTVDKNTLAAQLHRKTWIICSPLVGRETRTIGSAMAPPAKPQTLTPSSDRESADVDCERVGPHPTSATTSSSSSPTDEFDSFGKVVAAKLRNMSANQRLIAEKLVHDVMFHGQMGVLLPATTLAPLLSS